MTKKYIYNIALDSETAPAKMLRLVEENQKILEIGCASGVQSKILTEQLGCAVTGIEINPDAASDARKYCERVIVGNIEQVDLAEHLPEQQYDIVMFADVLEHLYDPGKVLEKIKSVLSDDGYVLASIPNVVHSSVIFEMLNGNFDYRQYGLLDNTHIRFFTKKTIYQLFEKAGFVISHLDRVTCRDCDTEFGAASRGKEDQLILDYIRDRNPENETFQFIIKAYKAREGTQAEHSELLAAQEKIRHLEETLKEKELKIRQLNSALEWITTRPAFRFLKALRHPRSASGKE